MIQIFPFALWLAVVSSAVLLIALWGSGDMSPSHAVVLVVWLIAAAYLQFFAASPVLAALGLALQTLLAVYLVIRMKLTL